MGLLDQFQSMQWAANPTIVPEQRGTFLPASIPPHVLGTQPAAQPAVPGVIHAPWQAFQNLWQAATDERNGAVPNDSQNARNAFDVAGAATTGGLLAPKPAAVAAMASGKAKPPSLPPSLIDAPRMVSGEVLDAVAPAAAEMQSPHWPKSWFEGTAAGPDTLARAKLFVRDMEARDRANAVIEPIMYPNGERAMSRAEAETIAMRNPEHAAVLEDAYRHKTNLYEHANPQFASDPYGPVNYPSPPGDTSRADAFVGQLDAGLQRASGLADQARAAGMPLPEQPFLLDQGMSAARRQGVIK